MKTIGLLGGMSWESTELYYRRINEGIRHRMGGLHSARIAMFSVDFHEIETLQHEGDWEAAAGLLTASAQKVEAAGADFLLICTNTMHKVASQVEAAIQIPLLHLADATAEQIVSAGYKTVGLLGTAFTMEEDFYTGRLRDRYGLEVIVPDAHERSVIHRIIYEELCLGVVNDASRETYLQIMNGLQTAGAEAIIEGCTEIVLLVDQRHTDIPLFDTTSIHAQAAVTLALGDELKLNPESTQLA